MAEDAIASIIALHQPKRSKTPTKRARSPRPRKRQNTVASPSAETRSSVEDVSEIAVDFRPSPPSLRFRSLQVPIASYVLSAAAFALAAVGVTTNGWFARSLGSTEFAGWLFLAIGVAADLAALVIPICAASLWHRQLRAASITGWAAWVTTFAFAVMAGIGFASTNINDVTAARAARLSPVMQAAQTALSDAMSARDRECGHGVGKFCREREAAVAERRQILDVVLAPAQHTADPQTDGAIKLITWLTQGMLRPSTDDLIMLRLLLLAFLPQIGGILLMVSRSVRRP